MSHHDPSHLPSDMAAGGVGIAAGLMGIMDWIHTGISWFVLIVSAWFLWVRLYKTYKPFFCGLADRIRGKLK